MSLLVLVAQASPHWGIRMSFLLAALHFLPQGVVRGESPESAE